MRKSTALMSGWKVSEGTQKQVFYPLELYAGGYSGGIAYLRYPLSKAVLPVDGGNGSAGVGAYINCITGVKYTFKVINPNSNYGLHLAEYEDITQINNRDNAIQKASISTQPEISVIASSDGIMVFVLAGRYKVEPIHVCTDTEIFQVEIDTSPRSHLFNGQGVVETLSYSLCKGGYFSTKEAFALKVIGKSEQNGAPSPDNPIETQCVKQGTIVYAMDKNNNVVSKATVPCDLYANDVWYPTLGKVIKSMYVFALDGTESWTFNSNSNDKYFIVYEKLPKRTDLHASQESPYTADKATCNIATFSYVNATRGGTLDSYYAVANSTQILYFSIKNSFLPEASINGLKQFLSERYASGNPVVVTYRLETPIIEQYAPQPIFAPEGTVRLTQSPLDLTAELSATHLVKEL